MFNCCLGKRNFCFRMSKTFKNNNGHSTINNQQKPLLHKKVQTEFLEVKRSAEDSSNQPHIIESQPFHDVLSIPHFAIQNIYHRTDSLTQHPNHDLGGFQRGVRVTPLYQSRSYKLQNNPFIGDAKQNQIIIEDITTLHHRRCQQKNIHRRYKKQNPL